MLQCALAAGQSSQPGAPYLSRPRTARPATASALALSPSVKISVHSFAQEGKEKKMMNGNCKKSTGQRDRQRERERERARARASKCARRGEPRSPHPRPTFDSLPPGRGKGNPNGPCNTPIRLTECRMHINAHMFNFTKLKATPTPSITQHSREPASFASSSLGTPSLCATPDVSVSHHYVSTYVSACTTRAVSPLHSLSMTRLGDALVHLESHFGLGLRFTESRDGIRFLTMFHHNFQVLSLRDDRIYNARVAQHLQ